MLVVMVIESPCAPTELGEYSIYTDQQRFWIQVFDKKTDPGTKSKTLANKSHYQHIDRSNYWEQAFEKLTRRHPRCLRLSHSVANRCEEVRKNGFKYT